MRHLPLVVLLCSGCDEPTEASEAVETTAQTETSAPDTGPPAEPDTNSDTTQKEELCKAEEGDPTTTIFFCLEGMTCVACDSALELVLKATFPCVIDADLTYDEPPGIIVEMYEGMVETDDIVEIIEVDRSLYSVTCIEER